jgi:hypothetical protein
VLPARSVSGSFVDCRQRFISALAALIVGLVTVLVAQL